MKTMLRIMMVSLLALGAAMASAGEGMMARFQPGVHYKVLTEPSMPRDESKVEVAEIFWYGCPHCYHLEPLVQGWKAKLPADVDFLRIPAQFSKQWQLHAALYYMTEVLGVTAKTHGPIFDAIQGQKMRLFDKFEQQKFLAPYGVSEADFNRVWDSNGVRRLMAQADQKVRQYQVNGVPAIIVNGKYMVDAASAGGQDKIFAVVDYLIEQERAKLKGKK